MRLMPVLLCMLIVCCAISARAGAVVERVKARGVVHCGGVRRPGLADVDGQGRWTGLNVDVCRGIAAAVLSSPDRIEYHEYETPKQFDAVRNQKDDVFFLTGSEINEHKLAGKVVPGQTVFVESHNVMVPFNSAVHHVGELGGETICFLSGSLTERSLAGYFDALQKNWLHLPFSEEGEMNDAYNVQRCHAIAGEITTLAATRLKSGVNRLASHILPEPLSVFPVMATTGTNDAQWTAIVAWTVITLISAERPETRWYAGGAQAMPVTAPELGLDREWQRRVLAAVGNYEDIFGRNLGKGSPLKLDRGLNANQLKGGVLLCPFIE
jgi:general L-amino acid transport system substrate-binding protein